MGFEVFKIVLDPEQPVYMSGQAVKGHLKVSSREPVDCRAISIWIKGKAKVRWTTGSGKNKKTYRAEETYFRQEVVMWNGAERGGRYAPGCSSFPFNFLLPANIPSSFASPYGKVIYKLKAQADLPYRFDQFEQKFFSVNHLYDLNRDPASVRPLQIEKEKTVCCLCCADGPIKLSMMASRTGYVPGESLVVQGEVNNHSFSTTIKYTEIKLEQLITYIARSHKKRMRRTVQRIYHPQLEGGKTDVWSNVPLPIPAVPASHLIYCNLITIDYAVAFVAKLGTCRSVKAMAPVIIGTLPLERTYSTFVPSVPPTIGGTVLTYSVGGSGRNTPTHFNPDGPLPPEPNSSSGHVPTAPPSLSPFASPSAPPVPRHQTQGDQPVPSHLPYSDPPPPYSASLLPDEYVGVPPPSYASCVFRTGRLNDADADSVASDDEGGFAPRYLTYRTA